MRQPREPRQLSASAAYSSAQRVSCLQLSSACQPLTGRGPRPQRERREHWHVEMTIGRDVLGVWSCRAVHSVVSLRVWLECKSK